MQKKAEPVWVQSFFFALSLTSKIIIGLIE